MRRYLCFAILLAVAAASAAAQDDTDLPGVVFTEGGPVYSVTGTNPQKNAGAWEPNGIVLTHDCTDSIVLSNLICGDAGFEPFAYSSALQVSTYNTGKSTYFSVANQYANWIANELYNGSYTQWAFGGGNRYAGTITGNNATTSSAVTANTPSSGALAGCTIVTASIPGIANGTYQFYVHGGGGSGGVGTFTVSGASLSGSGYTGGSITSTSCTGGTGYTTAPTMTIMPGFTVTATSSGQFSLGDYVVVQQIQLNTVQAAWPHLGWFTSGTVTGVTSNLPNDAALGDLPAGTSNTQAIQLVGPASITNYQDQGNGYGGQNHVNILGPMQIKFTAYTLSGSGTVTWSYARAGSNAGGFSCSGSVTVNTTQTVFTVGSSCSPNETISAPIDKLAFALIVPTGITVDIDNASVIDLGEYTLGLPIRDSVAVNILNYGGGVRVLDNQLTMTPAQVLQPDVRGELPYSFDEGCSGQPLYFCANLPPITMPIALALRQYLHQGFWYVVPAISGIVSAADGSTYAQYLGGTCASATTGAQIRCEQGQTTPWTTQLAADSAVIHLEHGNEPWNVAGAGDKLLGVPTGATTYTPYGYAVQATYAPFKADASYSAATEDLVMGAQTCGGCGVYAMNDLATSGTGIASAADTIAQAYYWVGFPSVSGFDTATPASLQMKSALAEAWYDYNVSTSSLYIMANAGYPQSIKFYEGNSGTQNGAGSGVPTQAELDASGQNALGGGLVNAIISQESCAKLSICGFKGFFSYQNLSQTFSNGSVNVTNDIWGCFLGSGAQNNNRQRPTCQSLQVINKAIPAGATMIASASSGIPTWSFVGANNIPAVTVPTAYIYGWQNGTARAYIVICADPAGNSCPLSLAGVTLTGTVTKTLLTSANLTDNNDTAQTVAPVTSSVPMPSTYTAPPFSLTTFTGMNGGMPTASTPAFSIAAGAYASSQSVAITTASGSVICTNTTGSPATDGGAGCQTGSTLYSAPIMVSTSETLYAVAGGSGYTDSAVASAAYVIHGAAAAPAFAPGAGTYSGTQSVAVSDATAGASIYCTQNGATPTTASTAYTAPIAISASSTLKCMAAATAYTNSPVTSAAYVINGAAAAPTYSLAAGTYSGTQTVAVSDTTPGAVIYCTTDGSTPTTASAVYSTAFSVAATETIQCLASATSYSNSAVSSAAYVITAPIVANPVISPAAGNYTATQAITITDATSGASIYYTVDGSTPTASSTLYTAPITVSATTTVKALATAAGSTASAAVVSAYTIGVVIAPRTLGPGSSVGPGSTIQ